MQKPRVEIVSSTTFKEVERMRALAQPPILQIGRHRQNLPVAFAHSGGLGEKVRHFAALDGLLANRALP